MFYEMFRIGVIPTFPVPEVLCCWMPRTWLARSIFIAFCYTGAVIGYYAHVGLIAGVGAVAVVKIVFDRSVFIGFLKDNCYGFTESMLPLQQLVLAHASGISGPADGLDTRNHRPLFKLLDFLLPLFFSARQFRAHRQDHLQMPPALDRTRQSVLRLPP